MISPHATVFATVPNGKATKTDEPRLTVGFAMSEKLLPEEIGRTPVIFKVADAVKVAMEHAGITDVADVHYVQTKTPLITIHTIRDAKSRVTGDPAVFVSVSAAHQGPEGGGPVAAIVDLNLTCGAAGGWAVAVIASAEPCAHATGCVDAVSAVREGRQATNARMPSSRRSTSESSV